MTVSTFRAHCARGHERIDFEGAAGAMLFEAHMKAEHKRSKLRNMVKGASTPYPWKAPAVPKDWQVKLAAILEKASTEHQTWPRTEAERMAGMGGYYTSNTPALEGWEVAS